MILKRWDLEYEAVDLKEYGINNFAFDLPSAISYMCEAANNGFIGTENSIVEHLQYKCPEKSFYPLSKDCVCHNMQATTLMDVYRSVKGITGEEIVMSDELIASSRKCIDEMLRLGK